MRLIVYIDKCYYIYKNMIYYRVSRKSGTDGNMLANTSIWICWSKSVWKKHERRGEHVENMLQIINTNLHICSFTLISFNFWTSCRMLHLFFLFNKGTIEIAFHNQETVNQFSTWWVKQKNGEHGCMHCIHLWIISTASSCG